MTGGSNGEPDESERLKELGHLSAAVGHHVINAFSAVVSNAELIRSHGQGPNRDHGELSEIVADAWLSRASARRATQWLESRGLH